MSKPISHCRSTLIARGARAVDLLIAAIAVANDLPLFTSNVDAFRFLTDSLNVMQPAVADSKD